MRVRRLHVLGGLHRITLMGQADRVEVFVGCNIDAYPELLGPGRDHYLGINRPGVVVLVDWLQTWLDRNPE